MKHANGVRLAFGFGLILAALLASSVVAWKLGHDPALGPAWRGWLYPPLAVWEWWRAWGQTDDYRGVFQRALLLVPIVAILPPVLFHFWEVNSPLRVTKPDPVAGFGTSEDLLKTGHIAKRGDGVVIGKGGWRKILRDHGDGHVLIMGPSRLGKGAGHVVPTLLSHSGSMLVFDPKHELAAITGRRRLEYGKVAIFDPTSTYTAKFNPLLELRTGARLIGDCQMAAGILANKAKPSAEPFWDEAAQNLLTALLTHARTSDDPTLANVWRMLLAIRRDRYPRGAFGYAKDLLDGHRKLASKMRDSINETLLTHLSFLADPLIQEATSGSDFRASDLQADERPFSLFLTIPVSQGKRLRPLTRLMLEAIISTLTDEIGVTADGRLKLRPVLGMIDEFPQLGRLDAVELKMPACASYGLRLCLVCQDEDQITAAYGQNQSITANCSTVCTIAGFSGRSLQTVERWGGRHQVTQSSKQMGAGLRSSSNLGQSESQRSLLDPGTMLVRSRSEVLVFTHGCHPTWLRKVRYWREPEYRDGYDTHSPRTNTEPPADDRHAHLTRTEPEPEPDEPLTATEAEALDDLEDLVCGLPEHVAKRFRERLNTGEQT